MRKFLLLVFSFFIPIILWLALVTLRENYVWSNLFENQEKVVILGDSHAEPLDIPESLNLANGGDPLLMPLLHLRRLTQERSSLELSFVILTVGPQNFSSLPEDRLNQKEGSKTGSRATVSALPTRYAFKSTSKLLSPHSIAMAFGNRNFQY